MTPREKLIEDMQFNSARTSETTRYIAFGLLAIFYTGHVAGEVTPSLFWAGLLGAVAITLDYLHYLSGYVASEVALHKKLDGWSRKSLWRRGRFVLFWIKQAVVIAGVIALIVNIFSASVDVGVVAPSASPS